MKTINKIVLGGLVLLLPAVNASADKPAHQQCDELMESLHDGKTGASLAQDACQRAVQEPQSPPRIFYQLGLALQAGGKEAEAAPNYRKAAEQGYAPAQYELGRMYESVKGGVLYDTQAAAWYRKAADQGYAGAQALLGFMYLRGQGVPHNDDIGAAWVLKAAQQGVVQAQYSVGVLYAKGRGLPQDDKQSLMWLNKAAANGSTEATAALKGDTLHGQMSAKDAVGAAFLGLILAPIAAGIIADSDRSSPPASKTSEYDRELERQRLDHRLRCDQGQTFFCRVE